MKKTTKNFTKIVTILIIALFSFSYTNAQSNQADNTQKNYEIMMQTVVGTDNAAEQKNMPSSLSQNITKLKQNYLYKNYRLISTNIQRVSEGGSINYRTLTNDLGGFPEIAEYAIYFNWNLNLIEESDSKNSGYIKAKVFNFDASFPNKRVNLVSYEKIQLSLSGVSLKLNNPTVIGSISIPQTDETLFFVLTVKETKN